MGELCNQKEGVAKKFNSTPYVFGSIIAVVLVGFLFILVPSSPAQPMNICGDGSFFETCALNKPYYCNSGVLISDPARCGCPSVLDKENGECTSELFGNTTEISLRYVLRGEVGYLNFPLHSGIQEYLDTLPRQLYYEIGEIPRRDDFKLMKIDDPLQREILIPLLVAIQNAAPTSKIDQVRIAISVVQNIPYGEPEFKKSFGDIQLRLSRYPYQVLNEFLGSCEGKSELLTLLLREMGYGTALFYYGPENHEAVGIKCPTKYSLNGTGYCFVETTVPAPISYSTGTYLGIVGGKLNSMPQPVVISPGISLEDGLYEYSDSEKLSKILDDGAVSGFEQKSLEKLRVKYDLTY